MKEQPFCSCPAFTPTAEFWTHSLQISLLPFLTAASHSDLHTSCRSLSLSYSSQHLCASSVLLWDTTQFWKFLMTITVFLAWFRIICIGHYVRYCVGRRHFCTHIWWPYVLYLKLCSEAQRTSESVENLKVLTPESPLYDLTIRPKSKYSWL